MYVPGKALLTVLPPDRPIQPKEIFPWPADAQFRLSDVSKDGLWIDGKELEMIWDAINHDNIAMPVFIEEGTKYGMILQIPGVSSQDPPYDC